MQKKKIMSINAGKSNKILRSQRLVFRTLDLNLH